MTARRIVSIVWLVAGVTSLIHDAATGDGIVGYLQYRELLAFGAIESAATYAGAAIPLVVVPALILMPRSRKRRAELPMTPSARRRQLIACIAVAALLGGLGLLALREARAVPGGDAPTVRVAVDSMAFGTTAPYGIRVVLRGMPRTDRAIQYDELSYGRHGASRIAHRLVPMTEEDWTPDRPVRFVTDLRDAVQLPGLPRPGAANRETAPGVLLSGAVPGYLRRAFAAHGVTLAPDAMLHRTDLNNYRQSWYGIAIVAGILSVFCIFGGLLIR